ncbi:hypothetical protein B0O80DRAFT_66077 [Mortierella sp. GBAus27b]|nr:hypothetical protein B0O80DRAFT_66077 [Mortierella sp. GBAus27b]
MFVLSWIRPSDAAAAAAPGAEVKVDDVNLPVDNGDSSSSDMEDQPSQQQQDDWVFLPSDHHDLMESSISDLDLLSASMTLYRPSAHPASSRTRTGSSAGHDPATPPVQEQVDIVPPAPQKSKRQLKQERRQQQALAELERKPRYDPVVARMRDQEFKMAKMAKMGLRSGNIMSTGGGTQSSSKNTRGGGTSTANASTSTSAGPQQQQQAAAVRVC